MLMSHVVLEICSVAVIIVLYILCYVPHLLKTTRNYLANFGSEKNTRYMWNDEKHACYMWNEGMFLLWNHIADFFYSNRECGVHILPKLTFEHINTVFYYECQIGWPSIKFFSK